jgi:hypothetical protein
MEFKNVKYTSSNLNIVCSLIFKVSKHFYFDKISIYKKIRQNRFNPRILTNKNKAFIERCNNLKSENPISYSNDIPLKFNASTQTFLEFSHLNIMLEFIKKNYSSFKTFYLNLNKICDEFNEDINSFLLKPFNQELPNFNLQQKNIVNVKSNSEIIQENNYIKLETRYKGHQTNYKKHDQKFIDELKLALQKRKNSVCE